MSGLFLGSWLILAIPSPVAAEASRAPTAVSSSDRGATYSGGRVELGAPSAASRGGFMRFLGTRVRSLIAPGAGISALAVLAAAAAAYGVLHALGPGHQKTLITGYLLSEGGGPGTIMRAAFISSASHAASVVLLFGGLALLRGGLAAADGELARLVVTRLSALILVFLALRMVFIRVRSAYGRLSPNGGAGHGAGGRSEVHSTDCACGAHGAHDHGHGGEERGTDRTKGRSAFATIVAGSLVPCPGAAFFLLYGFSAGNPLAGVLSVVAISTGMWATLVAVGFIAMTTRDAGLGGARGSGATDILRSVFEVGGSLLILAFAIALFF